MSDVWLIEITQTVLHGSLAKVVQSACEREAKGELPEFSELTSLTPQMVR